MPNRRRFRKRPKYHVTAVQLDLAFDGFSYQKWNHLQTCKPGDWLVNNSGDVYTIDKKYFRDYYEPMGPGVYRKAGEIWAEVAMEDGAIKTLEGSTAYEAGDYLVFDRKEGGDGYAIKKPIFERMYEPLDEAGELTEEQRTYIENRIRPKIETYAAKAKTNRFHYHLWQMLAIIAAALVPVFSGFVGDNTVALKWMVALLGGASAVAAGLLSLFQFQKNWIRCRGTSLDLESHLSQFEVKAGPYRDSQRAFDELADNCESILNAERGKWAETGKKDVKPEEKGR